MEVDRDRHIVVAAVALVRDGHVLTVRKRGTERFMLVGGKLEPGESAREAALRETYEEVGLGIESATLLGEFLSEAANEPGHSLHSTVFWVESDAEPGGVRRDRGGALDPAARPPRRPRADARAPRASRPPEHTALLRKSLLPTAVSWPWRSGAI